MEDNTLCYERYKEIIIPAVIMGCLILGFGIYDFIKESRKEKSTSSYQTKCDIGYTLTERKRCITDYFIKAIYFSDSNEKVKLISDNYNINKIKKLIIDGESITPEKTYTFNEKGNHTIYISFYDYSNTSLLNMNEGNGIFSDIDNLIEVNFSDYFSLNYPDVRFYAMFNNFKNLKSVDLSNIQLNYNYYSYYNSTNRFSSEYFKIMDSMFNNCMNLTFVNFSNLFPILQAKYMFNNCISLNEIDISKTRIACTFALDLSYMFSNCISLKSIKLPNIFCEWSNINISYMFYNFSSLSTLKFNFDFINLPLDMSYFCAYCISLKNFNLYFDLYKDIGNNSIKGGFKNCSSLTSIHLGINNSFTDMSYLFYGCTSLISITTSPLTNGIKYMNYMFYDCHSLKNWNNVFSVGSISITDMSFMFSGCSNLTSVDFSLYNTNNINNYEGIFYNCHNLTYVDISSFKNNNLPSSKLSIFDDNYSSNITIIINNDFLSKTKIPSNSKIEIKQ